MIALRKPSKENYTNVNAYKSIALLNIIDKVLKMIVTVHMSNLMKAHNLLSDSQIKARKD